MDFVDRIEMEPDVENAVAGLEEPLVRFGPKLRNGPPQNESLEAPFSGQGPLARVLSLLGV